jgi:hypothetical protein
MFADAGEDETEVPQEEEAPRKKVMKRKVVRKVNKQDNSVASAPSMLDIERTQRGSALT